MADGNLLNVEIDWRNPFAAVCGWVCDARCERRCRRGDVDEPLAIRALKRFAADHASTHNLPLVQPAKVEAALEEGVKLMEPVSQRRFVGSNGKLTHSYNCGETACGCS